MNKTKELLIDITFDLLYKKGFCATAIMDVLKVANVTKGAMYYHFESKNSLVFETMKHYLEPTLDAHWITPLSESENPIDDIVKQVDALYVHYENKEMFLSVKHGSPLNNFINDMSDKEDEFFNYLQSIYVKWQECLEKALIKAQILKQTNTDFDAKVQAVFIISAIEGSITSAKAYNDLAVLESAFRALNNYIKSL